ncbi:hypothetical protein [Clostridioides difficile]|uniref:hypothetical protein n=1 Tax=Clostridioides difficile TaxID=1496 RepID=UPI00093D115D|nr:hypothetical protein [Clostridioides difficile]EGT5475387.1 hypothetical protein [Clostridioides difficile]MBG0257305.1 hypothetical protein [Clostridioides difficile]MCA0551409.1 hypothetical protein [Clostridioides difficile]MDM9941687.1 hypothetical protein [Clostridioides difficile]MDV9292162.1 hypothetical protein [Clostridioides difficile]
MKKKSYNKLGKFIVCFIISSLFIVFLSFIGGNFMDNLRDNSFSSSLLSMINFILIIIGGFSLKKKYPEYCKYQIVSGIILLLTSLIFDIIPRIISIKHMI